MENLACVVCQRDIRTCQRLTGQGLATLRETRRCFYGHSQHAVHSRRRRDRELCKIGHGGPECGIQAREDALTTMASAYLM
eukprot:394149-Amphidinium_carterae.2